MPATNIRTLSIGGLRVFKAFVKLNKFGLKEKFVLLTSFSEFMGWAEPRIQNTLDQYPWIQQEFCHQTDDGVFGLSTVAMCLVVCLDKQSTDDEKIKIARLVVDGEMVRAKTQEQFNFK